MNCKKCKKEIPEYSAYCLWCGAPQKKPKKAKLYQRPDGLFEKIISVNGKRIAFRAKTEKEVYRKILEYQETADRLAQAGRPFAQVAQEWRDEAWDKLAYNTLKSYKPAFQRAVEEFGDTGIRTITPKRIDEFIRSFASQGYAKKTVTTQLLILGLIMRYATVNGDTDTNPAASVRIPSGLAKRKVTIPSDEDLQIVRDCCHAPFGLFAYFLLYTGCRRGEALALQYRDVDFDRKLITIQKSVYYDNNKPHLKLPKTKAGIREIVLLDRLADKLPGGRPEDYLFPGPAGGLMTQSQFDAMWAEYLRHTGLQIHPHQLRHAYATALHEAGISVKDAQTLLGHADVGTTQNIYTHITEQHKREISLTLNNIK